MTTRRAAALLAFVSWFFPVCAPARPEQPAMQVVAAARIVTLADRVARSAVNNPERALAPAFLVVDQHVPSGVLELAPGTPQLNDTYVSVPVTISIDGRVARTVYAGYRITTYVRMVIAARDLAPDTILQADDLGYARVPFSGRAALDTSTFVGRKMRGMVARGNLLYPELTIINEIVRAGMPAVFIVHDGPVSLAADVIARTSGGLGDFVTIFNPQTQKALSGVVTGPNTVELTLPGAN